MMNVTLFTGETFRGSPAQIVDEINFTSKIPAESVEVFMREWARRASYFLRQRGKVSRIDTTTPLAFLRSNIEAGLMAENPTH